MAHQLAELAETLGLTLEGDPELAIRGLAGLDDAGPDELSFATGAKYAKAFASSSAGACIVPPDFDAGGRAVLRSQTPYLDFARAVPLFLPRPEPGVGVHALAALAADVQLGAEVSIGAFAVIGERARIGAGTHIHPHVTVYPDVRIGRGCQIHSGAHLRQGVVLGDRVVVQSGAVIGSDGFGFVSALDGTRLRVPHHSGVVIGDDTEIGANTTVDASHPGQARRGRDSSATWIGRGVKIDNLVQVAHGTSLGDGSTMCAQAGLAGSTQVGRHVTLGGQSAVAGHLEIADGTLIGGRAGVTSNTQPGAQLLGFPAMDRRLFGRVAAAWRRLPELLRRVRRIEERLEIDGE